jgi:hypothetical protein
MRRAIAILDTSTLEPDRNAVLPARGVEAIMRHRRHQQNPGQTDACTPCRTLGRLEATMRRTPSHVSAIHFLFKLAKTNARLYTAAS